MPPQQLLSTFSMIQFDPASTNQQNRSFLVPYARPMKCSFTFDPHFHYNLLKTAVFAVTSTRVSMLWNRHTPAGINHNKILFRRGRECSRRLYTESTATLLWTMFRLFIAIMVLEIASVISIPILSKDRLFQRGHKV